MQLHSNTTDPINRAASALEEAGVTYDVKWDAQTLRWVVDVLFSNCTHAMFRGETMLEVMEKAAKILTPKRQPFDVSISYNEETGDFSARANVGPDEFVFASGRSRMAALVAVQREAVAWLRNNQSHPGWEDINLDVLSWKP